MKLFNWNEKDYKWIVFILALLCIGSFSLFAYSNEALASLISFGGTLSGIILSVLAIIMTIVGETKSENTKDKLISLSENLEEIVSRVENATNGIESIVTDNMKVKDQLSDINNTIENSFKFVNKEIAIDKENTKKDSDINFDSFKDVFIQSEKNVEYSLFKDLCITMLFIATKKNLGVLSITYNEYIEAITQLKLNISINNQFAAWNMAFIFNKAIWNKDDEFNNFLNEHCFSKYYNEVNALRQYENNIKQSSSKL
ncbi:hypothetical protein [Clostridium diolis]|uniref:hypothetical protein n=1 Tax=Clostridium diolis TaxID=223919 RepID=UPI003AF6613A